MVLENRDQMKNFNISCLNYFVIPDSDLSTKTMNGRSNYCILTHWGNTVLEGKSDFTDVQMEPPLSAEVSFWKINIVSSN